MAVDKNKIIDRIAKLMALGKGNASEAESLEAMRKAQELMSEWSIDETIIEAKLNGTPDFIQQNMHLNQGNFKDWERSLLGTIARNNFCRVLFQLKSSNITIFGTQYDQEMTIVMYQFVRAQMLSLADRAFAMVKRQTSVNGKTWKNSYYQGMLLKIRETLADAKKTIEQKYDKYEIVPVNRQATTTAIVSLKNERLENFFKTNAGPVSTIQRAPTRRSNAAFNQGYRDGAKLALG